MDHTSKLVSGELVDVKAKLPLLLVCHGLTFLRRGRRPTCPEFFFEGGHRLQAGGMVAFIHFLFTTRKKKEPEDETLSIMNH